MGVEPVGEVIRTVHLDRDLQLGVVYVDRQVATLPGEHHLVHGPLAEHLKRREFN